MEGIAMDKIIVELKKNVGIPRLLVEMGLMLRQAIDESISKICQNLEKMFQEAKAKAQEGKIGLYFIEQALPLANALIRSEAERQFRDSTLEVIKTALQKSKDVPTDENILTTMADNILSVSMLFYLLERSSLHTTDKILWEKITDCASPILEKAINILEAEDLDIS